MTISPLFVSRSIMDNFFVSNKSYHENRHNNNMFMYTVYIIIHTETYNVSK